MSDQQPPPPLPPQPNSGAPVPPWESPQQAGAEAQGFFRALFDFSFTQFVTLKFAKFIYVLLIVALALSWLSAIIGGFTVHPGVGIGALLLGWIPLLIALIFYRMAIEFVVATIRTAQNTSQLVARR